MIPFPTFPHLPPAGDAKPEATYQGVGEVIHRWESVEFDLSRTFAAAMGRPDGGIIPFYGENGRIFKDRLALLKLAVDHEFVVRPNQELEARFDKLQEAVTWYADRRNEVAHTVVHDLSLIRDFDRAGSHFFAIPPFYAFTKRAKDREAKKSPPYAFSSSELLTLSKGAFALLAECRNFRHALWPNEWPTEQRGP